jgi:hypothetical protein
MTANTSIHDAVREHYAGRIKSNASCCGPDACSCSDSRLYPAELYRTRSKIAPFLEGGKRNF